MEVAQYRCGGVVAVVSGYIVAETEIDEFVSFILADKREFQIVDGFRRRSRG